MDKQQEIKFNSDYKKNTEEWLKEADRDKEDLEEFKKEKRNKSKNFSCVLIVIILFLISILGEIIIYNVGNYFFIKEISIIILIWIWRIILINFYLFFSYFKMNLAQERIFITVIIALVFSVLVSIIFKILFINNAWVYLNLLVEPIWIILLIIFIGSLYIKFIFKN